MKRACSIRYKASNQEGTLLPSTTLGCTPIAICSSQLNERVCIFLISPSSLFSLFSYIRLVLLDKQSQPLDIRVHSVQYKRLQWCYVIIQTRSRVAAALTTSKHAQPDSLAAHRPRPASPPGQPITLKARRITTYKPLYKSPHTSSVSHTCQPLRQIHHDPKYGFRPLVGGL